MRRGLVGCSRTSATPYGRAEPRAQILLISHRLRGVRGIEQPVADVWVEIGDVRAATDEIGPGGPSNRRRGPMSRTLQP
jgi:hypothetical protein